MTCLGELYRLTLALTVLARSHLKSTAGSLRRVAELLHI